MFSKKSKKEKNTGGKTTKSIESESESSTRKAEEITQETQKRKNVEGESESSLKETTQKASKKQKTSSIVPTQQSERIAKQVSDLATRNLLICSDYDSSYGLKDLPSSASKFTEEDVEALKATFQPASNEEDVIPDLEGRNYAVLINSLVDLYL
jgi:hypothetical protein